MSTNNTVSSLEEIRIRYVYFGDFRRSEATLLEEVLKIAKDLKLSKNDCVLMMSGRRTVLRFVFGFREVEQIGGAKHEFLGKATRYVHSRTYRIVDGGSFNPYMLKNYAEEIGLSPAGIRRYEEALAAEQAEKRDGHRRAA